MDRLKEVNKECYDKLAALDLKVWTKSHFTSYAKSDMLMNNISDTFNGRILEARNKPILTIFEWIRCYWMGRFAEKKKKGAKFMGKILSKPRKRLDIICRRSMEWQPRWAGDLKYECPCSTTRSATVSQRGREMGRGRGGSRPRKSTSATLAAVVSQPAPPASATTTPPVTAPAPPLLPPVAALDPPLPPPVTAPTPPVTAPAPPLPPPDPRNSTAPPVPLLADPPQPAPAPTRSTAPPLSKTKNFGVRRSGRFKIGVRKAKAGPTETIDLTAD
ncbi:uncharacterized protein LOC107465478 [Arachis duranensis]|uniref:Uncharacterized protein LOC107465478 n=1 Tax=Arachis duranensis TaxID=130453 RepID=A0A6P4C1M4_ARADU|nr:uncharacterized protein LOC107465478 [Arachis duranensis]